MCLAIPGKIESVSEHEDPLFKRARVNFGGIIKDISLAYVPQARVGEYVIVHVGFAISQIDEKEAEEIFSYLDAIGQAAEQEGPSDPSAA